MQQQTDEYDIFLPDIVRPLRSVCPTQLQVRHYYTINVRYVVSSSNCRPMCQALELHEKSIRNINDHSPFIFTHKRRSTIELNHLLKPAGRPLCSAFERF